MNQQAKAKREFPYVTLILVVTLVLVVLVLGYTLFDSWGVFGRMDTAAKSNNYKISENQLDVYRYHVAQNQLYTEFLYYQYGLMTDSYGITSTFSSAADYANYMLPNYVGSGYFDETAYSYAEQYLTYCEGALEAGVYDELKDKTAADVEDYIDSLKEMADINGVTFNNYLKQWIGNGVSENDVKKAMTHYYIGVEYAEQLQGEFADATTLEEIEKYRDDNMSSFYTSKYTYYKLVNNDMKEAIDACTTIEEVKTVIVDYYVDQKFEELYQENITDADITDEAGMDQTKADVRTTILALNAVGDAEAVFTSEQTSDYEKAAYTIVTSINTSAKTEVEKVKETSASYADPTGTSATDLQKWLFGTGRAVGDYTTIETSTDSTDSSTGETTTTVSYTWYIVEETMILDTEMTKNAYYLLLTDDEEGTENAQTAAQKAEAMYNELAADKSPEKFAELVEKYSSGSSSALREQISQDSVDEALGEWLYEEGRAEGDIANIETEDSGNYVVYYVDENEETWKLNARDAVANEKLSAWYEDAVVKYNVTIDYEIATEAATTEAATEATTDTAAETTAETTAESTEDTAEETADETADETAADTSADTTAETESDTEAA